MHPASAAFAADAAHSPLLLANSPLLLAVPALASFVLQVPALAPSAPQVDSHGAS